MLAVRIGRTWFYTSKRTGVSANLARSTLRQTLRGYRGFTKFSIVFPEKEDEVFFCMGGRPERFILKNFEEQITTPHCFEETLEVLVPRVSLLIGD